MADYMSEEAKTEMAAQWEAYLEMYIETSCKIIQGLTGAMQNRSHDRDEAFGAVLTGFVDAMKEEGFTKEEARGIFAKALKIVNGKISEDGEYVEEAVA